MCCTCRGRGRRSGCTACPPAEREFFIDNLLVRIHSIIVMTRWTGLAPWEFDFPFSSSPTSTFKLLCLFFLARDCPLREFIDYKTSLTTY